jgi:hypothetical protein
MAKLGHPGRSALRVKSVSKLAIVLLLAAVAAWTSFAVSAASILRAIRPDLALEFLPFDARAKARSAELHLATASRDRSAVGEAADLARSALERDPTVVSAWRTLALTTGVNGNGALSARLFHFAESLSRRDLPTQLWLIEDRVAANDVPAALEHYDIALRTSSASADMLLPVMVAATSEASMVSPIARLLATDPPWRREFLGRLVENAPSPANAVAIVAAFNRPGTIADRDLLTYFVDKLVGRRAFDEAWQIYRLLDASAPVHPGALRNGDFERRNLVPPFDWQLEGGDGIGSEQRQLDHAGAGASLYVYSDGRDGVVARQVLAAPAGDYVLSAQIGAVEGETPVGLSWQVACGNANGSVLAQGRIDQVGSLRQFALPVHVPSSDCPAQWLFVGVLHRGDSEQASAWVDSVRLSPSGARLLVH